jgi:uncharacterized protein
MNDIHFYQKYIAQLLGIKLSSIENTIKLLDEGASIPFISRYRKEVTGNLDEVQIGDINKWYNKLKEIDHRKESIISTIEEQGKMTPELKQKIELSYDLNEIEDLYLPFKKKRKTKADIAREKGLEPLADMIWNQTNENVYKTAEKFLNEGINDVHEAIKGAQDIIAEKVSEMEEHREYFRNIFRKSGVIYSKAVKSKTDGVEDAKVYKDYFEFNESIFKCPSHRFLAMMRGDQEGYLRVIIDIDETMALSYLYKIHIKANNDCSMLCKQAIEDSYKRLIVPSVENQIRNEFKLKADAEAIKVFTENLRQLLLAAPLGQKATLAIDPGFRTGCKVAVLDDKGDLLYHDAIYPHEPQKQIEESKNKIIHLVRQYEVHAVAIGNGTASRETKEWIDKIKFDNKIEIFVVSENGASIYSASDVAREEFPDKDVTVRGAVSIGRRLMDPLAELVKIDPKSIGVGQYQHDVDQTLLKDALNETVMSCVNRVGININTASRHLLNYVSGLGPTMSSNIVKFRTENGFFTSRQQLLQVPRLGAKAFEQCAGFLRIRNAHHPLDNTGVHPESYYVVENMARDLNISVDELIINKQARASIKLSNYTDEKVGLLTLQDIMKELEKPGLDPRGEAKSFHFDENVKSMADIYEGMILPGIVTNMTNFGAFVDIGIKQDALLHISQITKKFIKSPSEVLKLHQEVKVKVLNIDADRNRVNLTLLF